MFRRSLAFILSALVAFTLVGGAALASLSVNAVFRPGDLGFALQQSVEQARLWLVGDPFALAEKLLDLVERRLDDLEARLTTEHEPAAVTALETALGQAGQAVLAVPEATRSPLTLRLARLVARRRLLYQRLTVLPMIDPERYAQLLADPAGVAGSNLPAGEPMAAGGLTLVETVGAGAAPATATPVIIPPHGVPFPPNATPGPHTSFLLIGQHTVIGCEGCHAEYNYRGTPHECVACHANVLPANHYPGDCQLCHTTAAWTPATFNHTGFADCAACHTQAKPANHYPGQCSQCHTTEAWLPATFNHAGFADCAACHTQHKPANHFAGQCSLCHGTTAWLPATFNHTGLTDCAACHTQHKPANHFAGQCSQCHGTTAWLPATFNHTGFTDCAACHTQQKPANHYAGQCSLCHGTSAWKPAAFNHAVIGNQDCSQCHVGPANHWPAPCSSCHTDTGNWRNARFDHSQIGSQDCAQCHQPPANHFPGACRSCHTDTGNWRNATFRHNFPTNHGDANNNCGTCHPGNNYGAWSCANCHNQAKMDEHHKEVRDYSGNCLACHPSGNKGD